MEIFGRYAQRSEYRADRYEKGIKSATFRIDEEHGMILAPAAIGNLNRFAVLLIVSLVVVNKSHVFRSVHIVLTRITIFRVGMHQKTTRKDRLTYPDNFCKNLAVLPPS